MSLKTITLRNERHGRDVRRLWAGVAANRDLIIEGQDLGPSVSAFWGEDLAEYEWRLTIRAVDVPRLVAALGGGVGDAVLPLLSARFADDERCASRSFLDEHGIPLTFWSRAGD